MAKVHVDKRFENFHNFGNQKDINSLMKETGCFNTNADFYVYLAALGFSEKRKFKTESRSGWGEIEDKIFDSENKKLERMVLAIALSSEKDFNILKDTDKCYEIFEDYVNGGFEILLEKSQKYTSLEDFTDDLLLDIESESRKNRKFEDNVEIGDIEFS